MLNKLQIGPPKPESQPETEQPQNQPESSPRRITESQNEPSQAGSTEPQPDHFDGLINESAAPMPDGTSEAVLSKADFHSVFCGGFQAASAMTGYKSLRVEKSDDHAKAAADAIYDTLNEIPALQFLLKPQGRWMQRAVIIGSFAFGMSRAVAEERMQRLAAAGELQAEAGGLDIPDYDFSGGAVQ